MTATNSHPSSSGGRGARAGIVVLVLAATYTILAIDQPDNGQPAASAAPAVEASTTIGTVTTGSSADMSGVPSLAGAQAATEPAAGEGESR